MSSASENFPLVLELLVWQDSAFLSNEAITDEVERFKQMYPEGHKVSTRTQHLAHSLTDLFISLC